MRVSAIIIFALLFTIVVNGGPITNPAATNPMGTFPASNVVNQGSAGGKILLPGPSLTSAQATALAIRLANDKADALFHHRPFQDGRPAQLVTGKWVWTGGCGAALLDYEASVTLSVDGSTNRVDVQLLDDSVQPMFFRSMRGLPVRPFSPMGPIP